LIPFPVGRQPRKFSSKFQKKKNSSIEFCQGIFFSFRYSSKIKLIRASGIDFIVLFIFKNLEQQSQKILLPISEKKKKINDIFFSFFFFGSFLSLLSIKTSFTPKKNTYKMIAKVKNNVLESIISFVTLVISHKRFNHMLITAGLIFTVAMVLLFSFHENHHPYSFEESEEPPVGDDNSLHSSQFKLPVYTYQSALNALRYQSNSAWRPSEVFEDGPAHRPALDSIHSFKSKGEYIKQPLVADYASGTDKIFLMIKTGATVLWNRLPIHLTTTLTRVPNFAIYSDSAASVGGYEVIDILQNVTEETKSHEQLSMYRSILELKQANGGFISPSRYKLDGGWSLDKFKNLPMLLHAYNKNPNLDWYIFMDADSYIMFDNLMAYLRTLNPNRPFYLGSVAMYNNKAFNHGGSGVIISRKAMEETFGKHPEWVTEAEETTIESCCGDYMVAYVMQQANIYPPDSTRYPHVGNQVQGEPYQKVTFSHKSWCERISTFHHLDPSDIELLWEYERLIGPQRRKNILYADIYRDFVAPHIDEVMSNWDNLANELIFDVNSVKHNDYVKPGTLPWKNFEHCQRACEDYEPCLSWRYSNQTKTCGLAKSLKLGRPQLDYINVVDKSMGEEMVSGFMIPRIRAMRSHDKKCDILYKYKQEELDTDPFSEGWYRRLEQADQNAKEKLKTQQEKGKEKEQEDGTGAEQIKDEEK
jgi:hypothetical protein